MVRSASELDKSLPWGLRKQHTIDMFIDANLEEIQVITADKLHNLKTIKDDIEMIGEKVWERFNHGKLQQHWYYAGIVKELTPRKKDFKLIRELEKEVKAVFESLKVLTDKDISLLFTCAYDFGVKDSRLLNNPRLAEIAMELTSEANRIYREEYETVTSKLDDLFSRGLLFQSNSEGPFILASFCISLQKKLKWTDQELYNQFKRNESFL